jgi:RNA 3'-terminal phosphate cyclase
MEVLHMSLAKIMEKRRRENVAKEVAAKLLAEIASGEELEVALPRVLESYLALEHALGERSGVERAVRVLAENQKVLATAP